MDVWLLVDMQELSGLQRLGTEMLELLWSYHLFIEESNFFTIEGPTYLDALKRMTYISLLTQDIVLRLCKLDDKPKESWSFERVAKNLGKWEATKAKVKKYQEEISNLKEHHRNAFMAHLPRVRPENFKPAFNIADAIQQALAIYDQLSGERSTFMINDGGDSSVDLRARFNNVELAGHDL